MARFPGLGKRSAPAFACNSKVVDIATNESYFVGPFLGSGGFAECYEIWKRGDSRNIMAGKIIDKKRLEQKESLRKRVVQEMVVFKYLDHPNIVRMLHDFTTTSSVVIIMELCSSGTLADLLKRRRAITEEETRFFTGHIVEGLKYLRDQNIIHRDIKPANLFLDSKMKVKIGDFGLAIYDSDRRGGTCGTPNYMAPELLEKKMYSYEVDIWALGCTFYGLIVGKAPFDMGAPEKTSHKIRHCDYHIPSHLSEPAKKFIRSIFQRDPACRLRVHEIEDTEFFNIGFYPKSLTSDCFTRAPVFDKRKVVKPPPDLVVDDKGTLYQTGEFLHSGRFGNIYVMYGKDERSMAARIIKRRAVRSNEGLQDRIVQEIRIMTLLKHPGIVDFYGDLSDDDSIYLLFDVSVSYPLSRLLKRRRKLLEQEVRYCMSQIYSGLRYLHEEVEIVHGNISTDALCLTDEMNLKISDFGYAMENEHAMKGYYCGLAKYMAPERYTEAGYSYETDMWALGGTMYELLTGHEFCGKKPSFLDISNIAKNVICRLVAHDPDERLKLADLPSTRFFRSIYCPGSLPPSAWSFVPEFPTQTTSLTLPSQENPESFVLRTKNTGNTYGNFPKITTPSEEVPSTRSSEHLESPQRSESLQSQEEDASEEMDGGGCTAVASPDQLHEQFIASQRCGRRNALVDSEELASSDPGAYKLAESLEFTNLGAGAHQESSAEENSASSSE